MFGFGRALGASQSDVLALIFCVALPADSDKDCDKNKLFHRLGAPKVLTFEISRVEGVGWIDLLGLHFDHQK